jgi:hypothetical protein
LIWLRARWYAPYLEQFIGPDTVLPDPTDPQDLNVYMHAKANPLIFRDPAGHRQCIDECCIETVPAPPVTTLLDGWLVAHDLADLQAEPEDVLLARVAFGEGRNGSPDSVADSVMVRVDENFGQLGTTLQSQILTTLTPYDALWLAYFTEDQLKAMGEGAGFIDNAKEAMDPTYEYQDDPQTGIDAFMRVYALVEPIVVAGYAGQLPPDFQGPGASDSFGQPWPPGVTREMVHTHGGQDFYQYPGAKRSWPWVTP